MDIAKETAQFWAEKYGTQAALKEAKRMYLMLQDAVGGGSRMCPECQVEFSPSEQGRRSDAIYCDSVCCARARDKARLVRDRVRRAARDGARL